MLTEILFSTHLALLLRQSLLLLRPACDKLPSGTNKWDNKKCDNKKYLAKKLSSWILGTPNYMQRIRRHGGGAALAILPLLLYLFFRASEPEFRLPTLLVFCIGLWLSLSLIALLATHFQRYNGTAFSTRDAGPADFGRRWPFWPDGALWLSELCYLILLYTSLYFLYANDIPYPYKGLIISSRTLLGLILLYVLWRNFSHMEMHYFALWSKYLKKYLQTTSRHQKSQKEAEVLELQKIVDNAQECLYILKLKTKLTSEEIPAAGFYMLRFLEATQLPRQQQNDHPLSLLSWQKTESLKAGQSKAGQRKAQGQILGFALEMRGFLEYIPQAAMSTGKKVQLWGPYCDIQTDFLWPYISAHKSEYPLLFIACQSGYSPLLQLLENSEFNSQNLCIICLELLKQPVSEEYWESRLQKCLDIQALRLPKSSRIQVHKLRLPTALEKKLLRNGETSPPKSKQEKYWQECQFKSEQEIFAKQLSKLLLTLADKPEHFQANWIYRGPNALQSVLKKILEELK